MTGWTRHGGNVGGAQCVVCAADDAARHGTFDAYGYRDESGLERVALVAPQLSTAPLVRVHSECLTGESLASSHCDCSAQLEDALERIAAEGGVLVYLRGHGARGIWLVDKLRAYRLWRIACCSARRAAKRLDRAHRLPAG